MKVLMMLVLAAALGPTRAFGQTPPERTAELAARELVEITGSGRLGLQVMDQMIASFRKTMPEVDEQFWVEFRSEVNGEELADLAVPSYTSHFSLRELEDLIAFYRTPLGQKVVAATPKIVQETMSAGQAWGAKIAKKALERLEQYKARKGQKS